MNPIKDTEAFDVIIVGAGPVGLGMAIDLALHNIRSLVIERATNFHQVPKGQNLTQRTGEHFRAWGITDQIRARSPIPRSFGNAGMVAWGQVLSEYHYDWFKRSSVNEFYFAENERLPQYLTEQVLRERAEQLDDITIVYGATAQGIEQHDGGVSLNVQPADGGTAKPVRAQYLVGCDGSRSKTRDAAGIEQDIDPHDKRMALLVFRSTELHTLLERFPGKSIYNVLNPALDGYWQFLGRVDLDGGWFYHAPVPANTTTENYDFTAHLHQAIGAPFAIEFEHIGFWDLRIAVARRYQSDRIFIAGDAAHSHPPYGGYGVNTGFEDARNLSWKLAAAINGWAGPDLLGSYTDERKPVFESTSKDFIGQMIGDDRAFGQRYSPSADREKFEAAWAQRASGGNDAVTQYLPHYEGSTICWGPDNAVSGAQGNHQVTARAGHHLSPAGPIDFFDQMGNGFLLITHDSNDQLTRDFLSHAKALKMPIQLFESADATDRYGSNLVLVRPDGFVAWSGSHCDQVQAVLRKACGW